MATDIQRPSPQSPLGSIPPLRNGDRLSRAEFLRRYHAMPGQNHAELIEGRVCMPSPVSAEQHGEPHFDLITWLGVYRSLTPGVVGGDNSTLNLDLDNSPQPDGYLRIVEQAGGQTRMVEGYLVGAPELIIEIAASSVSYDLHDKLNSYRRNGVREYLVWRTEERAIDWFVSVNDQYQLLLADQDGIVRSSLLPGLWLDPAAVIRGDMARALAVLQQGLVDATHQRYVEQLKMAMTKQPT